LKEGGKGKEEEGMTGHFSLSAPYVSRHLRDEGKKNEGRGGKEIAPHVLFGDYQNTFGLRLKRGEKREKKKKKGGFERVDAGFRCFPWPCTSKMADLGETKDEEKGGEEKKGREEKKAYFHLL